MTPSTALARAVVTALVRAGVREVVVAPGSRNAPISFALYDAAAAGVLRLHTRLDERTAGFLALGLAKTGPRAAVVCTSGTAVANLHPAMLEAAHAGVPLVAVSADRPARLRGTNANQTTDQVGIFAPVVATLDVVTPDQVEVGEGATHLNVRFDDPLVPDGPWSGVATDLTPPEIVPNEVVVPAGIVPNEVVLHRGAVPQESTRQQPERAGLPRRPRTHGWGEGRLGVGPRTVVVAGDDAGPPARMLAERAGWPLLAEPSSGSRTGDHAIRTYRLLLGDDTLAGRIERVVVVGHPTLSRPVLRLLARDDIEIVAAPAAGVWAERPFRVDRPLESVDPDGRDESGWFEEWKDADRSVGRQLDLLLGAEPVLTPYEVAGAVARALPAGGLLHVGASNPIRDLDLMVPRYGVGDRRKVIANRGLAGIDGTLSTAVGAALGRAGSTRALALMGDVTFLHDLTGLVVGPGEARPDLTVVVANDDGGSIFATLEQGAPAYADRFDKLFGTPHGVDLAAACAATHTPHLRVTSLPELEQALATPNGGIEVVEAHCRRDDRRTLDQRIRALRR